MKYVRVVFAVPDDKLEAFDEYLDLSIESDVCLEWETDHLTPNTPNPIVGAHKSAPYETREAAVGVDWIDTGSEIPKYDPGSYSVTITLNRHDADALAEFVDEEISETGLPDDDPFGLHALHAALLQAAVGR